MNKESVSFIETITLFIKEQWICRGIHYFFFFLLKTRIVDTRKNRFTTDNFNCGYTLEPPEPSMRGFHRESTIHNLLCEQKQEEYHYNTIFSSDDCHFTGDYGTGM